MKKMIIPGKPLTVGQIASLCKVAPRTVANWVDKGMLPGYRIPCSLDRRVEWNHFVQFACKHKIPMPELESGERRKVLLVGFDSVRQAEFDNSESQLFSTRAVQCGFDAGIASQEFVPHAIVIDFCIGRSVAIEIATGFRGLVKTEGTPIIGIACEDEYAIESLVKKGFTSVVQSPVRNCDVIDLVSYQISQHIDPKECTIRRADNFKVARS